MGIICSLNHYCSLPFSQKSLVCSLSLFESFFSLLISFKNFYWEFYRIYFYHILCCPSTLPTHHPSIHPTSCPFSPLEQNTQKDRYWERENQFSSMESHWYQRHSRAGPMLSWPTRTGVLLYRHTSLIFKLLILLCVVWSGGTHTHTHTHTHTRAFRFIFQWREGWWITLKLAFPRYF